jgi:hypothetical protein
MERPGASGLLAEALERPNLRAALKRVRQNRGSPGIDGMTVEELPEALRAMKDRVRGLTRRTRGRSLAQVAEDLRGYLPGWKAYFRLAETPRTFSDLDGWIRHRLRALQLKHWKRGPTIFRELRARGMSERTATKVAFNGRRWWKTSALAIHVALPNKLFDELGVPRLAA